jgi:DNA modification methylase
MGDGIGKWTNDIHVGDVRETLSEMPASSVHCVMTSPPYFGLRDYSADGQIGLEDSLDEYIAELVAVGEGLRRVLRDDGSWWLNLGDSYGPDKQKQLVPHRVAIALQDAGWVVRNDVTWVKPNPMPQSVKDRLNTTTEQVFHLAPGSDYWYDLDAIRESHAEASVKRMEHGKGDSLKSAGMNNSDSSGGIHEGGKDKIADEYHSAGKNPGDVFEVTTKPFPDAHFAVYPPELCEKPIKATCPPRVCVECGSPYERQTRDESGFTDGVCNACGKSKSKHKRGGKNSKSDSSMSGGVKKCSNRIMAGWEQTCTCDTDATEAGVCLDPFAGAGTTCLVAKRLGRRFIGVDLNPDYVALAQRRVGVTVDEPNRLPETDEETVSLAAFTDGGATDE